MIFSEVGANVNEPKFEVMMSFDQKMTRISMSMLLQHSYNFSSETLIELETMPLQPLDRAGVICVNLS